MSAAPMPPAFEPAEYAWLLLRFEADRRSRAPHLLARAQEHAGRHAPLRILDLGAGCGANVLYLAPRLPAPAQSWTLIDRDALLVTRVEACFASMARDMPGMEIRTRQLGFAESTAESTVDYQTMNGDFLQADCPVYRQPWDLVVANAVFDLLSAEQAGRFFDLAMEHWQHSRPAMYFTINLDHDFTLTPAAPHDAAVRALFHGHMQRQQGFGRALGPHSAEAMARLAGQRGFLVHAAESAWRIGADEAAMLHANLDFVDHAVHEMLAGKHGFEPDPAHAGHGIPGQSLALTTAALRDWLNERRAQIDRGELALSVGHHDLWITWPETTGDPIS